MSESLSCDQFTLPAGLIAFPSNVGSSIDSGSVKSLNHPTDGQTLGSCFGTPQNFVYMVSRGTLRKSVLKPSFSNSLCATVDVDRPGSALSPTMVILSPPVYLP